MKRLAVLLATLVLALATLAGPAFAQSAADSNPPTRGLPDVESRGPVSDDGGVAPVPPITRVTPGAPAAPAAPSRSSTTTRVASGGAPPAQVGGSASPSALAQTGIEVTTGALLAGGLLVAGAGAVLATRRRRAVA